MQSAKTNSANETIKFVLFFTLISLSFFHSILAEHSPTFFRYLLQDQNTDKKTKQIELNDEDICSKKPQTIIKNLDKNRQKKKKVYFSCFRNLKSKALFINDSCDEGQS